MIGRAVKRVVKRSLASRWGWRLAGPLLRPPGAIVLMYHRIVGPDRTMRGTAAEDFAAQLRWLRDRCELIHPDDLEERALRDRRKARPAVLVTFDDGYRDYHDLAYPVLKALGIPALVFVATSFLDEGGVPWTDALRWAIHRSRATRVPWPAAPAGAVELGGHASRDAFGERACAALKALADPERRAALAALLETLGDLPPRERQMLTWDEVRRTSDLTIYGGHSHTHPILARVSTEECAREIRTCRDRIVAETGRAPRYFAYPNGGPEDFDARTRALLREHGFSIAFATSEGIAGAQTDWMAVQRIPDGDGTVEQLAWQTTRLGRS
jgi:peptidoglycan/xylan/chitin deacetylase (PgdA/CDA1 family)